jgi:plasmid maintenance system antidote protein VapI
VTSERPRRTPRGDLAARTDGMTMQAMAEILGVSRQRIAELIRRAAD